MSAPGRRLRVEWCQALLRSGVPDFAVRVGLIAAEFGDPDGRRVFPGGVTIARELGLAIRHPRQTGGGRLVPEQAPRRVERAHAILVAAGWLTLVEDSPRRAEYRLTFGRDPDQAMLAANRGTKTAAIASPSIPTVTSPSELTVSQGDVAPVDGPDDRRYRRRPPSISTPDTVDIDGRPSVGPSPRTNAAPTGAGPSAEDRADRRDDRDLFDLEGQNCRDCGRPAEQATDRGPTCMRCLDARIDSASSSAPFVLLDHDRPAHHPSEATP